MKLCKKCKGQNETQDTIATIVYYVCEICRGEGVV